MKKIKSEITKVDIIDSKAPFLVKFGYLCVKKTGIPKWFGLLCFIISQLQVLGLFFKISFHYLPNDSSSIARPFEIFYKTMTIIDYFDPLTLDIPAYIAIAIAIILMLFCLIVAIILMIALLMKKSISMRIRNIWAFICYVHPQVLFFPIHIGSMRIIFSYYQDGASAMTFRIFTGYSLFSIVVNFLLAFFNSTVFHSVMVTKDPLASMNCKLKRSDIFIKSLLPILMFSTAENMVYVVSFLALAYSIYNLVIFFKYLSYYRRKALLLYISLQSLCFLVPIFNIVTQICIDSNLNVGLNLVILSFWLMFPAALKTAHCAFIRMLVYCYTTDAENLNPELIIMKRYLNGSILKLREEANKRAHKFNFQNLYFSGKNPMDKQTEPITKTSILSAQGDLLRKGLELHPKCPLIKLTLALHYIKYEANILKAYNLLEDVKKSQMSIEISISLYLVLFIIEEYLFEKYKSGSGFVTNGQVGQSQLDMLKYITMGKLLTKVRQKTIEQGEVHLKFWEAWHAQQPDYKELQELSEKAEKLRKKFQSKWKAYVSKIDHLFFDPYLVYGLYLTIIDNQTSEGEKMIELYNQKLQRAKHKTDMGGLISETLFANDNFHVYMSATKALMGNIMDCSQGIEGSLGFKREFLIGKPVTTIMTTFFRERHDGFILNYATTGKQRLIDKTHVLPCKKSDDYVMNIYFHLKINPMVETGMSYIALMRPINNYKSQNGMQFRADGTMDAITKSAQTFLGINAKTYADNFSVFEFCPDLWIIGEIFNRKISKAAGRDYIIDYDSFLKNAKQYYMIDTMTEIDLNSHRSAEKSINSTKNVKFDLGRSSLQSTQRNSFLRGPILKNTDPIDKIAEAKQLLEDGLGYLIDPAIILSEEDSERLIENYAKFEGNLTLNRRTKSTDGRTMRIHKTKLKCGIYGRIYTNDILKYLIFYLDILEKSQGSDMNLGSSIGEIEVHHNSNDQDEISQQESDMSVEKSEENSVSSLNMTVSSGGPTHDQPTERFAERQVTFGENEISLSIPDSPGTERRNNQSLTIDNYNLEINNKFPESEKKSAILSVLEKFKDENTSQNLSFSLNTAKSKVPVPKINIFTKFNPIIKKIIHKVKDPKLIKKNTITTENDGEKIINLKERLRRRIGTHIIQREANLHYQSSTSSSVSNRHIKVEHVIQNALKTVVEERWVKAVKVSFLILMTLLIMSYIVKGVLSHQKYFDWQHKKNVVENSFRRIDAILYVDQYIQILNSIINGFYNFGPFANLNQIGLIASILQQFFDQANSINNELKLAISTLDNDLQPLFYASDVTIYEKNLQGIYEFSYDDNAFRVLGTFIQRAYKGTNQLKEMRNFSSYIFLEDLDFINRNAKNDLIISTFNSAKGLHNSIQSDIKTFLAIATQTIVILFAFIAVWAVFQVRGLLYLRNNSSYFGLIFLKFQVKQLDKYSKTLKMFLSTIKREYQSKNLLHNLEFQDDELENYEIESEFSHSAQRKFKKLNRYPEMKRIYTSYNYLFARLLPLLGLLIYFLINSTDTTNYHSNNIHDLENQIISALGYLNNQTGLLSQILEIYRMNSSTTYRNNPIDEEFKTNLESFADISALLSNFEDETNNYRLDKFQAEIFYNYSCESYAAALNTSFEDCMMSTDGKGYTSLIEVTSKLYRMLKLNYEQYIERGRGLQNRRRCFDEIFRNTNTLLDLSRNLLSLLYQVISNNFDNEINAAINDDETESISKVSSMLVAGILTWFFCLQIASKQDYPRKCMMKMVPIPALLDNRYIKSYLIDHSNDELKTMRNFL